MNKIFTSIPNLLLSVVLCFVLSSCSSTGVKMNESSPWKTIQFEDQANALDVDFIDDKNGFLVGSNRLIMESNDGGETWEKRNLDLPRLMCEPGRSIVSTAGITIYKIGAFKEIPGIRTYISVDGGMSDNPRPITYQSSYSACLVGNPFNINSKNKFTIAGKHCESGDVLFKEIELEDCKTVELICDFVTGAYNNSMSSNYNRIPRPAALLVCNGEAEIIQKRESPLDLLKYDVLPDRFIKQN